MDAERRMEEGGGLAAGENVGVAADAGAMAGLSEAALAPAAAGEPSAGTADAADAAGALKRKRSRKPAACSKRAKSVRDPLAPKKAKTAFICFCERERPRLMALNPSAAPTDITKLCGEGWKKLSDAERKPYFGLAGADKERYHEALKTYEPPPEGEEPAAPVGQLSPAILQRAMLAEAKAGAERQLKLDEPARAQRCVHVVEVLRRRHAEISGSDEKRSNFLHRILLRLGAQEYSNVREFAQDVRLTLFLSKSAQERPAALGNAAIMLQNSDSASSATVPNQSTAAPRTADKPTERKVSDNTPAAEGAVDAQAVASPTQRRLLCLKFERLLDAWIVSPRKVLAGDETEDASCQTCGSDSAAKRSTMMRCVECDVAQHSCCLTPALATKLDHWCCKSCLCRLESEGMCLVDGVDSAKPKRKHRRTKGAESHNHFTLSAEGKYVCNGCAREYETESAVKGHCTKGCDGGDWKCTWCGGSGKTGQQEGPDGPATLCAACHSRYTDGATAAAKREAGMFLCDTCGQRCATVVGLAAHERYCDGGQWRCKWCKLEAHGRMPGPDGTATLCNLCGNCFRGSRTGAPEANSSGYYLCERGCHKQFGSVEGLLAHQSVCTGSSSQCDWCTDPAEPSPTASKALVDRTDGTQQTRTLCVSCATKFRPKKRPAPALKKEGRRKIRKLSEITKHACRRCSKVFDSVLALSGHQRHCDGGNWRCNWCKCEADDSKGKSPGPKGPGTLCSACGSRFRGGATGPPRQNADGKFVCETCERTFDSIIGLSSHRRGCSGKVIGAKPVKNKKTLGDDLKVFSKMILKPRAVLTDSVKAGATGGSQLPDPHLWISQAPLASGQVGLPTAMLPDILCLVDFFSGFHEQIAVPQLSVDELVIILNSPERLELAETVCSTMTKHIVMLSQAAPMPCGPTYFKYERENFYGIRAEQLVDICLDGVTWEAVLYAYTSKHVPALNVNLETHNAITRMYEHGFFSLGMRQRLQVLMHLTSEMLGTAHCREVMSTNLLETEMLDTANREETERRAKEEQEWAKVKAKRAPTAYNLYLQTELNKCKELDPAMLHKDAFAKSAANWRALGSDQIKLWTKRAKLQFEEDKLDPTQRQVLATLNSIVQKIVDTNNDDVQQQHQQILDNLSVRTVSLGTDRYYNRYWVMPAFPDKLWVEDCSVLTASFRPPAVATFLSTKGKVSTKVTASQNHAMELLDAASIPVLRNAGKRLDLSFGNSEQKSAMIKELMAKDIDGGVVEDLLKRLGDHKAQYYAQSLLSIEELEEWELVFPEKVRKSSTKHHTSKQPSFKTEEELIADETDGTVGDQLAHSKRVAERVLNKPGAAERLAAEFFHLDMPEERLGLPVDSSPSDNKNGTKRSANLANNSVDINISDTGPLGLKFGQSLTIDFVEQGGAGYKSGVREGMKLLRFQDAPVQGFDSTMAKLVATPRPWRFAFQLPANHSASATGTTSLAGGSVATVHKRAKGPNGRSSTADSSPAGGDDADCEDSCDVVKSIPARSTVHVNAVDPTAPDIVSAVAADTPTTSGSGSARAATASTGSGSVDVKAADTTAATSQPRQRQPRQKKPPAISLPPEITVRLEAAYQRNKAAETKARSAAERERAKQAATAVASIDDLGLDRTQQADQCKACLGSHRAHTCGRRKTLAPDVVLKKPKVEPLVDIPNYNEDEELDKMIAQQSKETGVDASKVRQWFEQRRKATVRRRGGGRTRTRAEQISELKSRSDPNWVPIGNKSKAQRDRTKDRSQRARSDSAKAKHTAEQGASPSWQWDLTLPPLIPPELENLPLQPPGAVAYWEESTMSSVHIVKNSRWRCYEDPEDVDALLAYLNPAGAREAALRRRLLIQAPALKAAMVAAKVKARKTAIEEERLSKEAAVALAREQGGLPLRRSRSGSAKVVDAAATSIDNTGSHVTKDGAGVRSEQWRRCDMIKHVLFQILEDLPILSGRATHGEGRTKWRNAVMAAVTQEDWKALLAPALMLGQDVQMVGIAYEHAIRAVGSKKQKSGPNLDPDPGGKHHRPTCMQLACIA